MGSKGVEAASWCVKKPMPAPRSIARALGVKNGWWLFTRVIRRAAAIWVLRPTASLYYLAVLSHRAGSDSLTESGKASAMSFDGILEISSRAVV